MAPNAKLSAEVQVKPTRSQVVIVSLILLSGVCFVSGFIFLWENKSHAWIPLSIGLLVIVASVIAWFKSQKDTDLEGSSPTSFTDNTGNQMVTDTRALMSPEVVQNMEKLFCTLAHREPLPDPDGTIDDKGNPIPNSEEEARERVANANEQAKEITSAAFCGLGTSISQEKGVQSRLDEPYSKKVIETNVGKT